MFKSEEFQKKKNDVLFILMGFFVFSSFSSTIVLNYLHLPMSLPEILFLPFVFLLRKKLSSIRFKIEDFLKTFIILILLLLIGILYGEFPLYSMLATTRSWFYLLMCMFIFSRKNDINSDDLMWLFLGSVTAWFFNSVLTYRQLISGILRGEDEVVTYGVMLAVPVLLATTIHKSRYILLSISIVTISLTVVFAGIRRLLVVAILSLFLGTLLTVIKRKKHVFSFFIIGLFMAALVSFSLPIIGEYVRYNSPVMYYRVFERTGNFLESGDSGSAGDQSRLNHFENFFDDLAGHTVPSGMVTSNTRDNWAGYFNDFPLYQLCWIYGWPIAFLILLGVGLILLRNMDKYFKKGDTTSFVSINALSICFMLLFLEGTYMEFPYATPITGLLLGRAWLNSKTKLIVS